MRGALVSAWLSVTLVAAGPTVVEHGSLVIAMPVASGWVVCGDKRKTRSLFPTTEDEVKVFELVKGVAAGMTGLRRVQEQGATLFDVAESVRSFQRTHAFTGRDDYAESLGKALGADFGRSVPRRLWPEVEAIENEAPSLFTVTLFWTTAAGLPRWADVNVTLRGGPRYASRTTRDVLATSNKLRPVVFGNLAVIDELQHGHLPGFDEARRDPDIRTFLVAPYAWRQHQTAEAERFGRRLIALTSVRLPDVQPKVSNVGPVADCVTVSSAVG